MSNQRVLADDRRLLMWILFEAAVSTLLLCSIAFILASAIPGIQTSHGVFKGSVMVIVGLATAPRAAGLLLGPAVCSFGPRFMAGATTSRSSPCKDDARSKQ